MFPSFPSLRERNLITLYGDTKVIVQYDMENGHPLFDV